MSVRAHLKLRFERSLLASGAARLSRRRARGDTLVLAYHNVVPTGEPVAGDRSLHLPQRAFAEQLDRLRQTHEVVPLSALLHPPSGGSRRPRAVVTFDDAYRGAVTAGVQELVARGLPATFCVAPGLAGRSFWWDDLAEAGAGGPAPALRTRALEELGGEETAIREWAEGAGVRAGAVPAHATAAGEEELRAAVAHAGITLACHSWSHPDLRSLRGAALERELALPLRWLRERFPAAVVPWLAYPYGLSSPAAAALAAALGYHGALRIEGGWIRGGRPEHFAVPRFNVPSGLSLRGFALRTSGLFCR